MLYRFTYNHIRELIFKPESLIEIQMDHGLFYTVNDLFSAQCPKEKLFLVNILVEKSSPFSASHHADVFHKSCQGHFYRTIHLLFCVCMYGLKVLREQKLILIQWDHSFRDRVRLQGRVR